MAKIQTNQQNWKFVGGRLCLDFINTVGGRVGATVLRDKFLAYSHLLEWTRLSGAASQAESRKLARHAAAHPHQAEATLAQAVRLRETLYRIFESVVEGRRPRVADLDSLDRELRTAKAHERLAHTGRTFAWTWDDDGTALNRILWPISLSAADLLTSGDLSRLRQCGGHECGWLFLDTSRNRSRHWCDMKDCGNRAKVSRFRQRHLRSHSSARSA